MGFFSRLKKEVWKVLRAILILGIIASIVVTAVTYGKRIKRPDSVSMVIDSDSGNEIDDLYAITLALIDPKITVIGLTSAQYNFHPERGGDSTVFESQRINEDLLKLNDMFHIPHPVGSTQPLNQWNPGKTVPSPAAAFIIEKVHDLGYGEKLNVVTLGAVTNLASALLADSTITSKIRWYGMGLKYNARDRIWDKNEFNTRNDLDAMDYLLNLAELETHIMTATTSKNYKFDQTETFDLLRNRGTKWNYLVQRWRDLYPEHRTWTMWDIAIIHAIMNPDMTTQKDVWTPPENTRRRISVYTWINTEKMKREFRKLVRKDLGDVSSDIE
ncbi:MAG: nucleoside hydrolase [Bacteroidales bacterium]|nr:nucleoside hydrolase [Bacteroidales bacterium]